MVEQGCSRLSADESGRILDRLAGMEKIILPELVTQALASTGKQSTRRCSLTNEIMIWVVLAMGLFTEMPIRQVFKVSRRLRRGEESPARSSLCMARQRLGSEPLVELHRLVVKPMATEQTIGAFYRGMRKVAIDGTVLDVPDCEAHEHFGRSSGSRGEGPFPQVRKVSLVELGTHIEFAFVFGGWNDSERKQVEQLWDSIPGDALLIEDRGFFSYKSWEQLHRKHNLLIRVTKSMVFKSITYLPDGSYLTKIYPSNWYRENDRRGIVVRIIEYKLDDPQRTGHNEIHRLMTNLFDAEQYPAMELILEYHERWEEEIVFDEQKTHQDPCRAEKTMNLRSETCDGLKQELYAPSLGHFIIRAMMLQAAEPSNIDVDRLSFKGCFQILKTRLPECNPRTESSFADWFDAVLWEMSCETTPVRRNRINPRAIKRKMSRWNKARPEHRRKPPLTKTFEQTVVMKT
ncbi:MAG: IS4 family transposase [Rhodopirellula sp.]|nr:IS4 family transposase [Rhodopirellula sp.]